MNKEEFLHKLRGGLEGMAQADVNKTLDYYREMIEDRMDDGMNEQEAVFAMGDPMEIAKGINPNAGKRIPPVYAVTAQEAAKKSRKPNTAVIWLLILLSPVWIPLLIALLIVVLAVYIVLGSIIVAVFAAVLTVAVSAVACIAASIVAFASGNITQGLVLLGTGIFCAGISIFIFMLFNITVKFIAWLCKVIFKGMTAIFKRKESAV